MGFYDNVVYAIYMFHLFVFISSLNDGNVYGLLNRLNVKIYIERCVERVVNVWENNKNKTLNDLAIEAFWKGSYIYSFVKHRCGKLYSTFPLIHSFVDALKSSPKSEKAETEYPWASITQLFEDQSGKLKTLDVKFHLQDFEWQYKTSEENFQRLQNMCRGLLQNNTTVIECLLLYSEKEDCILSNVFNRETTDETTQSIATCSPNVNFRFLMVNYLHDQLGEPYELLIEKPYYTSGNQILSGAFVGKLLTEQGYTGPFDKSYKVLIIDHEIKMIEWNYKQYIEFVETDAHKTYKLMGNETENICEKNAENDKALNEMPISNEDEDTKSWDKVDKE